MAEDPDSPRTSEHQTLSCLWLTKGLGRGGVERLMVDLYPLNDPAEIEVSVAYVLPWKDHFHQALESLGADVTCLGGGRLASVSWVMRLRKLVRATKPDVIHTHAPLPAIAVRLITAGRDSPVIVHTEHNMWSRYRLPTRLLNAVTYHRNDHVIAVSTSVAQSVNAPIRSIRPPITVIHHGTVPSSTVEYTQVERSAKRNELGLSPRAFVVGNVANFTPKKDHRTLLRAIAASGAIADVHLVLIGSGPLEAEIRQEIQDLGLSDRVTLLGTRDDVFELLPLFDAFCLSSRFEGFPISLIEAMASELPVVATRAGGISEIIENGVNGLLIDPGQPEQLRTALETLIEEPDLAESLAKAGKVSAEQLDLRTAARRTLEIYRSARRRRHS